MRLFSGYTVNQAQYIGLKTVRICKKNNRFLLGKTNKS